MLKLWFEWGFLGLKRATGMGRGVFLLRLLFQGNIPYSRREHKRNAESNYTAAFKAL